jgi:hypothetical protein
VTLETFHTKAVNGLHLAILDFDFEIRYKKGSKKPADFLSRNFIKIRGISAQDVK